MPISIRLPDDSVRELPDGATGADLALGIGPRLLEAALAVRVDGVVRDLKAPLPDQAKVAVVTAKDPAALEIIRHSTAHLLAQAVHAFAQRFRGRTRPALEDIMVYGWAPLNAGVDKNDLYAFLGLRRRRKEGKLTSRSCT